MRNMRPPRRHLQAIWIVALVGLGACSGPHVTQSATAEPESYAADLLELTNVTRSDEGLHALEASECARDAALERAAGLVGQDDLTHAPLKPVIEDCAPLMTAAENLVKSTAAPIEVVGAWLDSPGHRANILDPELTEIGIGCVPDGAELLCSQMFLGP